MLDVMGSEQAGVLPGQGSGDRALRAVPRSCVCPFLMCLFPFPVPWESSAVLTWAGAPPEAGAVLWGLSLCPWSLAQDRLMDGSYKHLLT